MATQYRTASVRSRNNIRIQGNRYNYGSVAPALDIRQTLDNAEREAKENPALVHKNTKRQQKTVQFNLGYVIFLTGAFALLAFVLTSYIRLQSDITAGTRNVAELEAKYLKMKLDNEMEYERIVNSVDLDEVKRIAVEELGMHYASEGQIITYTDTMSDYVRQYSDIVD